MIDFSTTPQEIFEIIAMHLLEQMEKATIEGKCSYLTENRLKCAAGILIPDGHHAQLSKKTFIATMLKHPDLNLFYSRHGALIDNLQRVHDCSAPFQWLERLKRLGAYYKLDTTFLYDILTQAEIDKAEGLSQGLPE